MDIFLPIKFKTTIQLTPRELHQNYQEVLKNKLQTSLEGVCSRHGYIKPRSIEILKRSTGMFMKQHFNGHIKFDLVCKAEVCNPPQGSVMRATVKNKNVMGLLAESSILIDGENYPVLDIIIPKRAAGIASDIDLEAVEIGDVVYVEVQGKRYQLHDKKISIIGRAVKEPSITPIPQDAPDEILDMEEEVDPDMEEEVETDEEQEGGASSEDEGGEEQEDAHKVLDIDDDEEEIPLEEPEEDDLGDLEEEDGFESEPEDVPYGDED
jgi:DNA-directed RNA polymerase subunit E'/Rpb7